MFSTPVGESGDRIIWKRRIKCGKVAILRICEVKVISAEMSSKKKALSNIMHKYQTLSLTVL